ncbi:MAG: hypothetical protein ACPGK2_02900 [Candidatus Poseidoniaceae archaeon]
MKRAVTFAIFAFISLVVTSIPHTSASGNLLQSGTTHYFDSSIVYVNVMDDNTILFLESDGTLISGTNQNGKVTELWAHELNVTASYAQLDFGEKMLAVIHDQGFLVFNIDNKQLEYDTQLSSIPDSLDWDSDGDLWIAYHSGTRKAREYSDGTYNNFQTTTVTSGFLSFVVLSNDNLVAGGFDSKLHIFDKYGNLIDQKNDPGAYISSLFEPEDGLLLAGTGNGELYRYDYNNSWSYLSIDLGTDQIVTIQHFDNTRYAAIDSSNTMHFIDKSTFTKVGFLDGVTTSFYGLLEITGQISVVYNSASSGGIMYYDIDNDGDGVVDSLDEFPADSSQQYDSDGDGYGDNKDGTNGDQFPDNSEQHADSDGDGYGDNEFGEQGDLFPDNGEQWSDLDSDGYGDNSDGMMGDQFIEDPTQWNDTDGDGYGDNPLGNLPDACPDTAGFSKEDRFGCLDTDFDFYSDPDTEYTVADGADALPNDGTQWRDLDGDGFGDNPSPAINPDSCPSVAGNSTKEIRLDGTVIDKLGCLDSDGDSFEDLTDEFPSDPTEWFDSDGDGAGSNTDYDDTEFLIVTEEDYCRISGDQSTSCIEWNDLDYQDYLARDKAEGEADLAYPAWLAQKEAGLLDEDEGIMGAIKDVAIVGGGVFIGATILILLASFVIKKRKINDLVKRYGVPFEPEDRKTANLEALEGTAGLSATGGIESDDSWDDDVEEMDFSEKSEETDEVESIAVSADDLYGDDSDMSDIAGMEISGPEGSEEEVSEMLAEEQVSANEKPLIAPQIPESGLPEGWTMEQWEWYGHEWLAKNGGK